MPSFDPAAGKEATRPFAFVIDVLTGRMANQGTDGPARATEGWAASQEH